MKIQMFENWMLNEAGRGMQEEINPNLRKILDAMKEGFNSDKEIVEAIEKFGFERQKTGLERTSDYRFIDNSNPKDRKIYISYTTGYVRTNAKSSSPFMILRDKSGNPKKDAFGNNIPGVSKGPITKSPLPSATDRLLFILRRAMKVAGFFTDWQKSNKKRGTTIPEFFEKYAGHLTGKKYGI